MLLVDSAGRTVGRAVSSEGGFYALTAPLPGQYVLRTLRIGHRPTSLTISLQAGEVLTQRVDATSRSVELQAVRVSDRQRCRVHPDSGQAAFKVWDEARKALLAAEITSASPLHVVVRLNERTLDPSGRELTSAMRADSGRAVQPFVSLPPDSLAAVGYIALDGAGYTAWAPDARVLLSESFANNHCLRLATRPRRRAVQSAAVDAADTSLIGVAFEPTRSTRRADVRGTLWLDRLTGELQSLEFFYANTLSAIEEADAGGLAEFLRLPDGRWIIVRWLIRAPVVETTVTPGRATTWQVTSLREFGGDVIAVRDGRASLWARARVPTQVRVVARGKAIVGARVSVDGDTATVLTDTLGVAALGPLLPGPHRLGLAPPLGHRDLAPGDATITVAESTPQTPSLLDVRLPTAAEVIANRCGQIRGAFLSGDVRERGPGAAAVRGATVDVTWTTDIERQGRGMDFIARTEARRTQSVGGGRFTVCDVPYLTLLSVTAKLGARISTPVRLVIPDGSLTAEARVVLPP